MPYKRINDSLFEIPDFERTFSENDKFIVIRDTYLYAEPNEESSRLFQINKGFSFREPNNDFNIKTYTSIDTNQILISCNECWLKILYQNTTGYIKVANIYGIYMDYPTFFVENNEGNWKISM